MQGCGALLQGGWPEGLLDEAGFWSSGTRAGAYGDVMHQRTDYRRNMMRGVHAWLSVHW